MESGRLKSYNQFVQFLSTRMGLNADSVGKERIRAVFEREQNRLAVSAEEYMTLLSHDHEVEMALYDAMVVAETWFLRGRNALDYLCDFALKEWLPLNRTGQLKILSIPCSSGEEPYSVVMMLDSCGFPMDRIHVKALDISEHVLASARAGVFERYSFRAMDEKMMHRYFDRQARHYILSPDIRRCVDFCRGNMAEPCFLEGEEPFDIVLCRNMLIYFTQESRMIALNNISKLLKKNGLLFVGHSEATHFMENGFTAINKSRTFAFRSDRLVDEKSPAVAPVRQKKIPRETANKKVDWSAGEDRRPSRRKDPLPRRNRDGASWGMGSTVMRMKPSLPNIRKLADSGRLDVAAEQCHSFLEAHPLSADGFCLLGIVEDAKGRSNEAENCFKKALYLAPNHQESLSHFSLLLRNNGEHERASILEKRM